MFSGNTHLIMPAPTGTIANGKITLGNNFLCAGARSVVSTLRQEKVSGLVVGKKKTVTLPAGSQNIRVKGQMLTGLFWEPKGIVARMEGCG
jgi:hypothetical protein